MSRRLKTDYIQPQHAVPLFTKGRLKGSNVKGLQHFEVIQGMWPIQNTESVDTEIHHTFPVIYYVVSYVFTSWPLLSSRFNIWDGKCCWRKSNWPDASPMQPPPQPHVHVYMTEPTRRGSRTSPRTETNAARNKKNYSHSSRKTTLANGRGNAPDKLHAWKAVKVDMQSWKKKLNTFTTP